MLQNLKNLIDTKRIGIIILFSEELKPRFIASFFFVQK